MNWHNAAMTAPVVASAARRSHGLSVQCAFGGKGDGGGGASGSIRFDTDDLPSWRLHAGRESRERDTPPNDEREKHFDDSAHNTRRRSNDARDTRPRRRVDAFHFQNPRRMTDMYPSIEATAVGTRPIVHARADFTFA